MKKIFSLAFISISFILFIAACSSATQTYETQLAAEKKATANFIKDKNITVVNSIPANNIWGENVYYLTSSGLYIHLDSIGLVNTNVQKGQLVLARYRKIAIESLGVNNQPDTILNIYTTADRAYPDEITYDSLSAIPCKGFQQAISIMRRHNSVARIIVPSKLGNTTDADAVLPYYYDFKIELTE